MRMGDPSTSQNISNLLQTNLLGVFGVVTGAIGTITGVISLFISWFNHKYNTPKIEIDRMYLIIPHWVSTDWAGKTVKDLENYFLDYELEIVVRNKTGGAGSIDKPRLVIQIPNGKNLFFKKYKSICAYPSTAHMESEKKSENMTESWTVRHGKAFNLGGGEKADDRLEYEVENPQNIFDIVNNFNRLMYFVDYVDNNGKYHKKRITRMISEDDDRQDTEVL